MANLSRDQMTNFLTLQNFKAVAEHKSDQALMIKVVPKRIENTVGKGGNSVYLHFHFYKQMFYKAPLLQLNKI